MLTRIREQLERCPELKASGAFNVSASSLELPTAHDEVRLEKLVLQVAEHVTDTVVLALRRPQNFKGTRKWHGTHHPAKKSHGEDEAGPHGMSGG